MAIRTCPLVSANELPQQWLYVSSPLEAGVIPTLPSSFPGMSTPGSSPQHRPAGISPLSLSSEARRQQTQQQVSPTLSPLSPITQVRGQGGVGWGWPGSSSLGGLPLLPAGHRNVPVFGGFCQLFKHMGNVLISGLESPVPSLTGLTLAHAM